MAARLPWIFNGCVPVDIVNDIATKEGRQLVRSAIQSLQQALQRAPAKISGDTLNLLGSGGTYRRDVETWRLIELGQAFVDLVDGKITTTAKADAGLAVTARRRVGS